MRHPSKPVSLLIIFCAMTIAASAQSTLQHRNTLQQGPALSDWTDPSTGLVWATRDSDKDLRWKGSMKYCRSLRMSGFSDWRLPNMAELQGIYDKSVEAPGLAGYHKKQRPFTWHIKGSIFLTGDQWSSDYRQDDRGRNSGYSMYFDFNEGKPNDDPSGWPYSNAGMRALCVRGSEKP
jgi:hypothetical protein